MAAPSSGKVLAHAGAPSRGPVFMASLVAAGVFACAVGARSAWGGPWGNWDYVLFPQFALTLGLLAHAVSQTLQRRELAKRLLVFESQLVTVAEQNARLAHENVALREADEILIKRSREQAEVAKLGHRALAGADLPRLLSYALEVVTRQLSVPLAELLELQSDGSSLLVREQRGWPADKFVPGTTVVPGGPGTHLGHCLSLGDAGEALVTDNLQSESSCLHAALGARCGVSVVIPAQRNTYGTLGVYSREPRKFTRAEGIFLQAVATTLATAIERSRADEARRELEDRFEGLLDYASDLVLSVAPDGRVLYLNHAWRETLGYELEELQNRMFLDLVTPASRDEVHAALNATLGGARSKRLRMTALSKGGQEVVLDGHVTGRTGGGKPGSVRGVFRRVS